MLNMYYITPKQQLKLSSWKSQVTLRLSCKKAFVIKKACIWYMFYLFCDLVGIC